LDDVQKEQAFSAIRTLLAVGSGFLVGHGYFNEVQATEIGGAIMTLVPVAWGIYQKRQAAQKSDERAQAAYNAGTSQMATKAAP
jgi:hypothetical protein